MRLVVALVSVLALAFVAPAAADRPTPIQLLDVFPDVNPCTGDPNTVTIATTAFVHEHGSGEIVRGDRTITTSDGFVGHGTDTFVDNGQVVIYRQTDILTNASGDKIRARVVFVLELSSETVRVENFELTCLGA